VRERRFQNNAHIDFSNQIPTAMPSNRARISAKRISTGNLISSGLTSKISLYIKILWGLASIKSFIFLNTGVKCSSIDWLDLIDNS
jgi:hypothetical protein